MLEMASSTMDGLILSAGLTTVKMTMLFFFKLKLMEV
jgi:hypothetical protein